MILLSADLSTPLLELLHQQPALVDAIEIGPWFSLAQIQEYRQHLPDYPFYFHGAGLLSQVGPDPGAILQINAYLAATDSPWISMHLGLWPPDELESMRQSRVRPPLPNVQQASHRLAWQARTVAECVSAPLLLENVEPQPYPGCEFEIQPRLITQLIETTGCSLVLDLAHALVSASALGMEIGEYLSALPLARVEQVHLSGPRLQEGRLSDAHEPLRPEDYELLAFVLARSHPRLVTLEYTRQLAPLREQLARLKEML
jgi:uncharacterized protein (UPF0276 family)